MRVLVIGRDPNLSDENSEVFQRVREYAELFDALHIINIVVGGTARAYERKLFIWPHRSRFFGAVRLGKIIARKHAVDVVDAQDPGESGLAGYWIAKSCGIPLRLQIHTDIFSPHYCRAGWKEWVRYWIARFLIPRADCLRVVSERIRKSILEKSNPRLVGARLRNISVLPIFTDTSKFLEAKPDLATVERFRDFEFKMIAVGRFVDKEKNFSTLIDMMRDFVKICPRALLVLVGDGPDLKNYKLQITNYKLDGNVILEGWRDDLSSFYKSFDLYLMSSNYEGWGRTVVEAMAAGLPVVMTDVGLAGEVVRNGENGIVVPMGDKRALLEAVINLYRNPEKRYSLAGKGQGTVKTSILTTKEEYLALYRESLEVCMRPR